MKFSVVLLRSERISDPRDTEPIGQNIYVAQVDVKEDPKLCVQRVAYNAAIAEAVKADNDPANPMDWLAPGETANEDDYTLVAVFDGHPNVFFGWQVY